MRSTGLCFQDRFWCVFEFVVLPEKSPGGQKNWKRHLLHDRRNVEHVYFRPIARQQERRVEEARAFSSTPLHRIEESREEVLEVVRRCGPPRTTQLSRTSVPPAVPNTPLQDDRLAWPGIARLLTGKLKPKPARHNGHGLFLKMVQMHRRTDTRRSKEFAFQAIAVSITNDAEKGEYLAFAVLDLVRICMHQVRCDV